MCKAVSVIYDNRSGDHTCPFHPGVSASQTSLDKKTRPPSINFSAKKFASSQSMDSNATGVSGTSDFCRALYDYDATGSDEISFEEGTTQCARSPILRDKWGSQPE